jgi:hypothetical protein
MAAIEQFTTSRTTLIGQLLVQIMLVIFSSMSASTIL